MRKRFIAIFLCTLMLFNALLTTTIGITATAETFTGTVTRDHYISGYYFKFTANDGFRCGGHYGQPSVWKLGSKFVYCIELGVAMPSGSQTAKDTYSHLTADQKAQLDKAMTYGYNGTSKYGKSQNVEYYATQIICWAISEGVLNKTSKYNTLVSAALNQCSDKADVKSVANKIKEQINAHNTMPSFLEAKKGEAKEKKLQYNTSTGKYQIVLTDSNKVLSYYSFSGTSLGFSKSGNKLTISTGKASLDMTTVTATRTASEYLNETKYTAKKALYVTDGKNNGKNGKQDVSTYSGGTDVVGYIKVQPAVGNIKIVKTSSDGAKSGFKFNVKNATTGYDKNFTTDENGKITISDLPVGVGKYTVTEKMTSAQAKKYTQPSAQTESLSAGETQPFYFSNIEKPRTLKIVKQTIIDGVVYKTGPNVAGFHFRVKSDDGTYNKTFTTDETGVITVSGSGNKFQGDVFYTVSEELTQAQKDEGYLDNPSQRKKVNYGGTATATFINRKDSGLQIIKTSEDGEVSDIWFEIKGIDGTDFTAIERVTDENGFIMLDKNDGIKAGKYEITELGVKKLDGSYEIPNRYIAPESQIVDVFEGSEVASVSFENKLKPGTIVIQKTADDGFVNNVQFLIKSSSTLSGEVIEKTVSTDENGIYEDEFPAGSYIVSEQDIDERYYSNSYQTQNVDLKPGETFTVTGGADGNMNPNKTVEINLVKIDKNTKNTILATDGLFELYEYDVVNDEYTATGEYMQWNNGKYSISKQWTVTNDGQFGIKEIKAPYGCVVTDTFITVDAKEHNEDNAVITIPTISMENEEQRGNIGIYKVVQDIECDEDGEAVLLGGAKFGIYAREDIEENGVLIYPKDTLVDSLITNNENAVISKDLPLGEYYLEETEAPYGYVLKKEKINVTLSYQEQEQKADEDGNIIYGTNEVVYTQYVTVENTPQKAHITIIKTDKETNKPVAQAEYGIYAREDIVVNNVLKHSKGTLLDTVTTDENGKGISSLLFLGKYEIKELTAPTGYVLDATVYSVELTYQGQEVEVFTESLPVTDKPQKAKIELIKTDKETNKPVAQAEYGIYTAEDIIVNDDVKIVSGTLVDNLTTDTEGKAVSKEMYLGKYLVKELTAPTGYVLDTTVYSVELEYQGQEVEVFTESLPVTDMPQKGIIAIQKQGEVLANIKKTESEYGELLTPVYENRYLVGAEYEIYAAEDIIVNGEVKENAGTLIDTVKTVENEPVSSKELYLGKYNVIEKTAPDGYVLNDTVYSVELTYQGQDVSIFTESLIAEDERQKVSVNFNKTMEENIYYPNEEAIKEVVFGIYTREDIECNGTVVIPANSLVDVITLDEDGKAISNTDLPTGKYYAKEIKTAKGYVLNKTEFDFEFSYSNQTEAVQEINLNDSYGEIVNEVIKGYVEIIKTSSLDGRELEGAEYGIYRKSDDKYIARLKTDDNGKATSKILPYGEYYLKEIKAPAHFKVNENVYDFFIGEDTEETKTITISVEDEPIIDKPQPTTEKPQPTVDKTSPRTGDIGDITTNTDFPMEFLFVIGTLVIGCYINRNKKRKTNKN